jgi:hypothetical protein
MTGVYINIMFEINNLLITIPLIIVHTILCSYIWYARGGSQGWLEIPDWFPSRASTGLVIFGMMAYYLPFDLYTLSIVLLIPYVWNLYGQSLGHGSYMDAGYWDRPDVQQLRHLLVPFKLLLGTDRSATYDFIGGLLKGIIMTAPIAALWVWYFNSLVPLLLIIVAVALPVSWFINNRWYTKLQTTTLLGAPVYWAELIFGATYGVVINLIGVLLYYNT